MTSESIPAIQNDHKELEIPTKETPRVVGYAASADLIRYADKLPSNIGRAMLVHTLIHAYGLLPTQKTEEPEELKETIGDQSEFEEESRCKIIPVQPLPLDHLAQFHDRAFLRYLLDLDEFDESDVEDAIEAHEDSEDEDRPAGVTKGDKVKSCEKYGLEFDCPYFAGLSSYIKLISGASVACADFLIAQSSTHISPILAPVSINWTGGRHHAKKARCSGFCYVNDAVLCIQKLRTKFAKVLYVDLDLHHGDGVETAFARSAKVACVSIHRHGVGFYPGTGSIDYEGKGPGIGYTLNIPTRRGLNGAGFQRIFSELIEPYKQWFEPEAVVVTVGVDGLARDDHKEWNLTMHDYEHSLKGILKWNLPTVLLGGGGYHHTDTARCWAYLTATALDREDRATWDDIPEHAFLNSYAGDAYQFHIDAHNGKLTDENDEEYMDVLIKTLRARIDALE